MRKHILNIVATLSIVIGLSVAGFAALGTNVRATIPFDFMVGSTKLPAGKYKVSREIQGALTIRSLEKNVVATSLVQSASQKGEQGAKLVFHRYGSQYFLSQVWDGQSDTGMQLPKSKAERRVAEAGDKNIAYHTVEPELVSVTADIGQ